MLRLSIVVILVFTSACSSSSSITRVDEGSGGSGGSAPDDSAGTGGTAGDDAGPSSGGADAASGGAAGTPSGGAAGVASAGAAGASGSPPIPRCGVELLADGGFENEPTGWTLFSSSGQALITHFSSGELMSRAVRPDTGDYLAWLGTGVEDTSVLSRAVEIPSEATTVTVSGRLWIATEEHPGEGVFDTARVELAEGSLVRVTFATWSNEEPTDGWTSFEVPMEISEFRDSTLTFRISSATDNNLATSFYFDTLSLKTCDE